LWYHKLKEFNMREDPDVSDQNRLQSALLAKPKVMSDFDRAGLLAIATAILGGVALAIAYLIN
jgi:hypothetical protein